MRSWLVPPLAVVCLIALMACVSQRNPQASDVTQEPPRVECVATDPYCMYVAAVGAYTAANNAAVAASRAGLIGVDTLEAILQYSDDAWVLLETAREVLTNPVMPDENAPALIQDARVEITKMEQLLPKETE